MSVLAAAFVAVGTIGPAIAIAAPDDAPVVVESPALNLRTLGLDPNIALYGVQGDQTFTFPVPPGLVPAELAATVILPVNARGGTLEVIDDNQSLVRVPLPTTDRAPIVIPLAGARVVDNAITVRLHSYLTLPDGYCVFDPTNPLRLIDTALRYTGVERAPTAVADFLPPVLQKLTVFVPPNPSRAESDAAIKIATAVVAKYGAQRTAIDLVPSAGPVPSPQLMERQIIVREGPNPGLSLQGTNSIPALLISGQAAELTNQARLLSSDLAPLAISSKAVVGPLSQTPELPGDLTTLRGLGQPGVNATALVNPRVTIPLDQTRFGRSVHGVRVHLQGSYTPLPASVGGQVLVSIGDQTIDRWATDSSGTIDRWVDVPDRLLQRYTSLQVAVDAAGNTGRCGEFQPITLVIDGESPVQSKNAKPPVPTGFQSMPQALMPRVEVGFDGGFDDLRRAVQILVGLQRLSARPFDTVVTSLSDSIGSANPALLISAGGWTDNRVTLPVAASGGAITVQNADGTKGTLTLDPTVGFGSLQATFDGNRSLLIATSNNAPQELDRLLNWLGGDDTRWSQLTGNAVISPPGRDPVTVTTDVAQPEPAPKSDRAALYWNIGGGVLIVLIALGAGLFALGKRRSRGQE